MKYDSRADALVVIFSDARVERTIEETEGRLVDVDDQGAVVAIEVLGVSSGFALNDLAERYGLEDALREAEDALPRQFYKQYA